MTTIPTPPNDGRLCRVSYDHVMSIRTRRGYWTRKQIEALGVPYPPRQGWLKAIKKTPLNISITDWERAAEDAGILVGKKGQPDLKPFPLPGMEPNGGNLYKPHHLMVNSGTFWHCKHGTTGWDANWEFLGCEECRKDDPEAFSKFYATR